MPHAHTSTVPPDRESDVTWHHVIVHGCKGQKYLRMQAHICRSQAQASPMWREYLPTWRGNYVYGSYLGVGIQVPMRQ